MKNAFLKEAKTVKTGTRFIVRDTALKQVEEHTEKQFKTEAKAEIHSWGERVCSVSLASRMGNK